MSLLTREDSFELFDKGDLSDREHYLYIQLHWRCPKGQSSLWTNAKELSGHLGNGWSVQMVQKRLQKLRKVGLIHYKDTTARKREIFLNRSRGRGVQNGSLHHELSPKSIEAPYRAPEIPSVTPDENTEKFLCTVIEPETPSQPSLPRPSEEENSVALQSFVQSTIQSTVQSTGYTANTNTNKEEEKKKGKQQLESNVPRAVTSLHPRPPSWVPEPWLETLAGCSAFWTALSRANGKGRGARCFLEKHLPSDCNPDWLRLLPENPQEARP